jgi:hypothetical protein
MQKKVEKEREEVRGDTRAGGSNVKDRGNGNAQAEASRNGNASGVRGGDNGTGVLGDRQAAGPRAYRQEEQRVPGPSQATLNEMWKGKERERDFRSWSEDMDSRMRELELGRYRNTSPYV